VEAGEEWRSIAGSGLRSGVAEWAAALHLSAERGVRDRGAEAAGPVGGNVEAGWTAGVLG